MPDLTDHRVSPPMTGTTVDDDELELDEDLVESGVLVETAEELDELDELG